MFISFLILSPTPLLALAAPIDPIPANAPVRQPTGIDT